MGHVRVVRVQKETWYGHLQALKGPEMWKRTIFNLHGKFEKRGTGECKLHITEGLSYVEE